MRIGIDARFISNGSGLGRYAYKLLEFLLKLDTENEYIVLVYKGEEKYVDYPYGKYRVVGVDFQHYSLAEQWGYWKFLNSLKCDLVHFTNFNHPILYRGKFVVTIHDLTLLFYPGRVRRKWVSELGYKLVMKSAVGNSAKVIAISEFTKRDILKYFGGHKSKIEVIYEAANEKYEQVKNVGRIERVKKKYKIRKPYFLYVGQWRVHKNLVRLIESFSLVKEAGHDTQLVLVGKEDPRYPEVREAIAKSKYRDDIVITGFAAEEDLSSIYSGAISFVFPSLYEGIGLPPLEAMQCGVPVISSDASCMPEILEDAVLYFDPRDLHEISQAMIKVYSDQKVRQGLIARGFRQVEKYSWEKMAQETLDVYKSVLGIKKS